MSDPALTSARLPHFVSDAPFDRREADRLTPELEQFYRASQWRMMWWKFRRHRLAVVSGLVILLMYASILISELIAPYSLHSRHTDFIYAPPQSIQLFHEGRFVAPFVYGLDYRLDMETLRREYTPNLAKVHKLRF
ncbi:MAG: ABC transporter permease, partial [Alphaproteobacteria bacterium]|nr:ABC transporter permease [Alphaproteobacteria bacterium]